MERDFITGRGCSIEAFLVGIFNLPSSFVGM